MINLFTGIPGTAKTLSVIVRVIEERKEIYKNTGKLPPVYYSGIILYPEHELFHEVEDWEKVTPARMKEIYVPESQLETGDNVYHSDDIKTGAIFIVDECQFTYPARRSSSAPEHVKFFTIHRHSGFNFYLITQEPGFIDKAVRDLVQEHRLFERHGKTESSNVTISPAKLIENCPKDLLKSETFAFPKKYYGLYKSAEFHTQTTGYWAFFKGLPLRTRFVLVATVLILAFMIPKLFSDGMGFTVFAAGSDPVSDSLEVKNENMEVNPNTYAMKPPKKEDDKTPVFYISHYMESAGKTVAVFDYVYPNGAEISLNQADLKQLDLGFKEIRPGLYMVQGRLITSRPPVKQGGSNEKDK